MRSCGFAVYKLFCTERCTNYLFTILVTSKWSKVVMTSFNFQGSLIKFCPTKKPNAYSFTKAPIPHPPHRFTNHSLMCIHVLTQCHGLSNAGCYLSLHRYIGYLKCNIASTELFKVHLVHFLSVGEISVC